MRGKRHRRRRWATWWDQFWIGTAKKKIQKKYILQYSTEEGPEKNVIPSVSLMYVLIYLRAVFGFHDVRVFYCLHNESDVSGKSLNPVEGGDERLHQSGEHPVLPILWRTMRRGQILPPGIGFKFAITCTVIRFTCSSK